jgi:uroporphyrinogen-III synthase
VRALSGYAVAVASERRRHDLARMLEHAGARVVSVQALRLFSPADEQSLYRATIEVLAAPIDELVVTSAFGFRAWVRAAQRFNLAEDLHWALSRALLLATNVRAADALREAGHREIWSTPDGGPERLFRYLLTRRPPQRRTVVQSDSPGQAEVCLALRRRGADVVEVPTYQCQPPAHAGLLRHLANQIIARQVDALVVTSALAAQHLLAQAATDGQQGDLIATLRTFPVFAPGPLSAEPLRHAGVVVQTAPVPYLENLVSLVARRVPQDAVLLSANGAALELRGRAVVVDGALIQVQPGPLAVLRALAVRPGEVLSCAEIREATPSWDGVDDHAVEMAVSRLRRSLEDPRMIQTVMRRGYRLAT